MNDTKYKWKNKEAYSKRALFWIQLANQKIDELSKQLLGLAVVLLPITASIVITDIQLSESQITLVLTSWVFLFLSVISGFIQICVDANYYKMLSRDSSKRELIWADFTQSKNDMERETKKLGQMPAASTFIPIVIQTFTIFVAILFIMITAGTILVTK